MISKAEVMEALEFLCDFSDSEEYQTNLCTVATYIGNLGDIINRYNVIFDDIETFTRMLAHKMSKEEE